MKEQYIEIRKNIWENQQKGEQVVLDINWFYVFYIKEFEKLPKSFTYFKKDMYGNFQINDNDEFISETIERQMLNQIQFNKVFGQGMMMYSDDILDHIDRYFNISWLCDSEGNKIKFIG